ncbi:MAG: hypothetical protein NC187_00495 [Candidatus Amulumruptor caecigallinarius]|nr:hypothetical protein [Candidatus Amulumruptor caecigallinarius]MCM1395955.1 hypothetical protein [Candidatus Amulumruptor caecigallinarius]MCM1452990.1 hypothetical protein [bacterium]
MATVILIILALLALKLLLGIVLSVVTSLSALLMVLYQIIRGIVIFIYHAIRLLLTPFISLARYLFRRYRRKPLHAI